MVHQIFLGTQIWMHVMNIFTLLRKMSSLPLQITCYGIHAIIYIFIYVCTYDIMHSIASYLVPGTCGRPV